MKKLEFEVETINAVLQYLGNRPYNEVNQLIQKLFNEAQGQLSMSDNSNQLETDESENERS
jgi:uncharacterized protein (UPF0297 family)